MPGPTLAPRCVVASGEGRRFRFTLRPGESLLAGVADAFAREGFASGALRLRGGGFGPFAYVIPSLPVSPRHAAYYSATFRPPGSTALHEGAMSFGQRDDAPFFHCHALWREADGRESGGHILPEECTVAALIDCEAVGITAGRFEAVEDPETNFRLFEPRGGAAVGRFHALRLRPNQDLAGALLGFCQALGIDRAEVHGGVGSIIGARYADGGGHDNFATELFLARATLNAGKGEAVLEAGMVDYTGQVSAGRLVAGDNPVLMTMELVLEALG